jgi:hypothetical protein
MGELRSPDRSALPGKGETKVHYVDDGKMSD